MVITNKLTNLTPWRRILLQKVVVIEVVNNFPAICGIWRYIIVFTKSRHKFLSLASCMQSIIFLPITLNFVLHYPPIYAWEFRAVSCFQFSQLKFYIHFSCSPRRTCPTPLIFLDFITTVIIVEAYKSWKFWVCSLLHALATSSHLHSNIVLSRFSRKPSIYVFP